MSVPMIETTINGRWTLLLPAHRAERPEWVTGWERERWDATHEDINAGDVVLDIGAEEGDLTALMASWGARVVAFEPNPRVWPNIRAIFTANDLTPEGTYAGFADDHTNERGLEPYVEGWPASAWGEVIGDHGFCRPEERPDLPRITLDDYCRRAGIVADLVTMDVEGSELRVLWGMAEMLRFSRPLVYLSLHPNFMQSHYQHTDQMLFEYMESMNYRAEHIVTDHEQHWRFSPR